MNGKPKKLKSIYAPKAQQIEGLTSAAKRVSLTQFICSIKALRKEGFLSKSQAAWVLSVVRKAQGISYQDFVRLYKKV